MCHADLRRKAAVIAAKPAFALLYTAVWYLVPGMGVWACGCVFGGGMNDAMSETFRLSNPTRTPNRIDGFFDWICQSDCSVKKLG